LNTFSEKEAMHWEEIRMHGLGRILIEKIIKMSLIPVNTFLEDFFKDKVPNFPPHDAEGLDIEY